MPIRKVSTSGPESETLVKRISGVGTGTTKVRRVTVGRPISAVADNYEVRNAKTITIKTNKRIKFNLLYDKNRSLQKKIKIEQLRREIN